MNTELQNLIKAALTDGNISDKELQILRKKATQLKITNDELELFIESEKYKLSQQNTSDLKTPTETTRKKDFSEIEQGANRLMENIAETVEDSINTGSEKLNQTGISNWNFSKLFSDFDLDKLIKISLLLLGITAFIFLIMIIRWIMAHLWIVVGFSIVILAIIIWYKRNIK